jgi:PAS domain S-box-containing protein
MNESNLLTRHLGIAFLFTLTAVLLTVIFWPLCQWFPPVLFLLAVLVSAWQGGAWQGLATTGFSLIALLFAYRHTIGDAQVAQPPPWSDIAWRAMLFVLVGALASYLSHQCRRAMGALDRVHGTLASLGDGLIFVDTSGRVRFLNPTAESLTGWKRVDALEQPVGKVFRCLHDDGRQPFNLPLSRVLVEGISVDLPADAVLIDAGEKEFLIEGKCTPHREESKATVGMLIAFRDVTKRRQEDREYRRREEQFRALAGFAPTCLLYVDTKGSCVSANAAWQTMSGLKGEECLEDGWARVVHPHDRTRVVGEWQASLRAGRDFTGEFRVQPRQGEMRWVQLRSAPMLSQRGQLLGHVAVVEDIEARRQAEGSLRAAENRATAFMRNFPGLAFLKDADGRYVYVNDRYAEAFGWQPGDWEGKTDRELLPRGRSHPFDTQARRVLEGLEDFQAVEEFHGSAGMQTLLVRQFPVEGTSDEEVLLGGLAVNLTEQKQAEEALKQTREEFERRWQDRAGDLKRSEEALKKVRGELEKLSADAAARQKQADEALRTARQELEQRTQDLRKAEKLRDEHARKLAGAQAELESVEQRFGALIDEQAAEHEKATASLRAQLAQLQPQVESLRLEMSQWQQRAEEAEQRVEPLCRERDSLFEENAGIREETLQLRQERDRWRMEYERLSASVSDQLSAIGNQPELASTSVFADGPQPIADGRWPIADSRMPTANQIVVNSWRLVDSIETWQVREHTADWLAYN